VHALNLKTLDRARDRFRQSAAKRDPFDAGVGRLSAHGSRAPARLAAELGSGPGAQTAHGRLPAADSAADAPGQPADDDAQGVLSAGPGGGRVDDGAGPGVSAGLSHAGGPDRADGTPVAALGADS